MWAGKCITTAAGKAPENKKNRYGLWVSLMLTGGDRMIRTISDLKSYAQLFPNRKKALHAIKEIYKVTNQEIDDRLDAMSAQEVIDLGETSLGKEPCEFLNTLMTKKNWEAFKNAEDLGIISMDDSIRLGNIWSKISKDEAHIHLALKCNPFDTELRRQASDLHLATAEMTTMLMMHICRRKTFTEKQDPLTLDTLRELYPKAALIGNILEKHDDICDIVEDYAEELQTGRPTGNVVIATFFDIISALQPEEMHLKKAELDDYIRKVSSSPQRILPESMPQTLQEAVKHVRNTSVLESQRLPSISRKIVAAIIDEQLKIGIDSQLKKKTHNNADQAFHNAVAITQHHSNGVSPYT